MFKLWLDFIRAQQVAAYMLVIDETTFMSWRPEGIAGVPSIPGV